MNVSYWRLLHKYLEKPMEAINSFKVHHETNFFSTSGTLLHTVLGRNHRPTEFSDDSKSQSLFKEQNEGDIWLVKTSAVIH